ncbi:bifunctional 4-hydroxy-2-oxoglutarate aldolase/2-dehydro-3-deoxy-phosphogluconate aldolase [Vibrio caribbeanicus]|uniref:bifunctional 4-hydroxy-2-oxoglutarate aldolase/2-dehydro-3-deoxy-phosphogluconate aldolase n=1 Tax=Vibrio caribbeanicus TaxID=701175 RepID=UPI0030DCB29C
MSEITTRLKKIKVIPILSVDSLDTVIPVATLLNDNRLPCIEVTFRTSFAADAIAMIREQFPNMCIGAGTVLTTEQVDQAMAAGADFIVAPGFNPFIVDYCLERNITFIPGVNNPSLIEQAMQRGLTMVKYFPAELSGGVEMLKLLDNLYPVNFMPTGGINRDNINEYLNVSSVVACGGTWLLPQDLIASQRWDEVSQLIRKTVTSIGVES